MEGCVFHIWDYVYVLDTYLWRLLDWYFVGLGLEAAEIVVYYPPSFFFIVCFALAIENNATRSQSISDQRTHQHTVEKQYGMDCRGWEASSRLRPHVCSACRATKICCVPEPRLCCLAIRQAEYGGVSATWVVANLVGIKGCPEWDPTGPFCLYISSWTYPLPAWASRQWCKWSYFLGPSMLWLSTESIDCNDSMNFTDWQLTFISAVVPTSWSTGVSRNIRGRFPS